MKLDRLKIADLVGMIGIAAFYPLQNLKLFITRDPAGLSLPAFVCLMVGGAAFAYLGLKTRRWGIFGANLVGLAFVIPTIIGIIAWG